MKYSIVIPTYKRPDVLRDCLTSIALLDYPQNEIEVIVVDNGAEENSAAISEEFVHRLNIRHIVNERNLGPGGSLNKCLSLARGDFVAVSNDDVILPPEILNRADPLFADPKVGILGFRAIEQGYLDDGEAVGEITASGYVRGNFSRITQEAIEVEHTYGFFYIVSRKALEATGYFDTTLLSKPYASGNRIETDQCLSARQAGFKVLYDGSIGIIHQAKPRTDIAERSLKWRLNDIRNTTYLFLKHYGATGRKCLAIRYCLLHDLGIYSLITNPSRSNWDYFVIGIKARFSAIWHWILYMLYGNEKLQQQ